MPNALFKEMRLYFDRPPAIHLIFIARKGMGKIDVVDITLPLKFIQQAIDNFPRIIFWYGFVHQLVASVCAAGKMFEQVFFIANRPSSFCNSRKSTGDIFLPLLKLKAMRVSSLTPIRNCSSTKIE